jgi:hypothetical protein
MKMLSNSRYTKIERVSFSGPREPRTLRISLSPKVPFFTMAYKQIDNTLVAPTTAVTSQAGKFTSFYNDIDGRV